MSMDVVIGRRHRDTLVDSITSGHGVLVKAFLVVGFSLLTAASARISIPLPFTPVPVTGQTMVVLLAGAALGSRLGLLSQVLYLLQGMAGLPVFNGGHSGPAQLVGPTGGYLVGFVIAAYVVGLLAERKWDRNLLGAAGAMLIGNAIIYGVGVAYLAASLGSSVQKAMVLGVYPFLVADLIKLLVAAAVLPGAWRLVRRWR